jgi:metal-responsive CopG/Arc/MetJ family transcriptional regulator
MQPKRKVSVTIRGDLVDEVDHIAGELARSAIFEQALAAWLRTRRRAGLDEAIERYYRALSDEEKSEDRRWAALGDETVRESWSEHED